jgi:hypothetical protein
VIDAATEFFAAKDLHLPEDRKAAFQGKIFLYCQAAVLRVLLIERQKNDGYEELLREFEKLIFPPKPTADGMTKLEAVKSAMKELDELFSEKKELSWCMKWFRGIGHEETNPAILALFAQLIGLNTRSIRQLVNEIGPPKLK